MGQRGKMGHLAFIFFFKILKISEFFNCYEKKDF